MKISCEGNVIDKKEIDVHLDQAIFGILYTYNWDDNKQVELPEEIEYIFKLVSESKSKQHFYTKPCKDNYEKYKQILNYYNKKEVPEEELPVSEFLLLYIQSVPKKLLPLSFFCALKSLIISNKPLNTIDWKQLPLFNYLIFIYFMLCW